MTRNHDRIIEDKYACVEGVWLDISIRPRNQLTVKIWEKAVYQQATGKHYNTNQDPNN